MRHQLTAGALAALLGFFTIGCDEQDYDDPTAPVINDTEVDPGDSYEVEDDTIYPDQTMDNQPNAVPPPSGYDTPETPRQPTPPTPPTGDDTGTETRTPGTEPDDAVSEVPANELPDDDGN